MLARPISILIAAAAIILPAQGAEAPKPSAPAIAFGPAVESFIGGVVIPGYRGLVEQAEAETTAVSDLCWQADAERLQAARRDYGALALAWARMEWIRFGPARSQNRYERIFFWPDQRGRGLQQVQAIIATEDASATSVESLRAKSVAVQGLLALEYVLYGADSDGLADTADPARSFRCRFGLAVAGAIALTAKEILDDWTKPDGYAALIRSAGPDNPVYRSLGEVAQELIKGAREQLQLARDLKIADAIGTTPDAANPKRSPFWRSGLTLRTIEANIETASAVTGPAGIGAALPATARSVSDDLAAALFEANGLLSTVDDRGDRWETLVADPANHADLKRALDRLGYAIAILATNYPDALGLIMGFNALDGD